MSQSYSEGESFEDAPPPSFVREDDSRRATRPSFVEPSVAKPQTRISERRPREKKKFRVPEGVKDLFAFVLIGAVVMLVTYSLHTYFTKKNAAARAPSSAAPWAPYSPPQRPSVPPVFRLVSASEDCSTEKDSASVSVLAGGSEVFSLVPPPNSTGGLLLAKLPSPQGVRTSDLAGFYRKTAVVRYVQDETADAQDVLGLLSFAESALRDGTFFLATVVDRKAPKLFANPLVSRALRWMGVLSGPVPPGSAAASGVFPSTGFRDSLSLPCRVQLVYDAQNPPANPAPVPAPSPA